MGQRKNEDFAGQQSPYKVKNGFHLVVLWADASVRGGEFPSTLRLLID